MKFRSVECRDFIYEKSDILDMAQNMEMKKPSVWKGTVHASFKKVIAFDVLFMVLGAMIGAGIAIAILFH